MLRKSYDTAYINKRPRNSKNKPIAFISMDDIPVDGITPKYEIRTPKEVKSGI